MQLGASVVAVDAEGLTPALACAPNPAVARCLATILAAHGTYINLLQFFISKVIHKQINKPIVTTGQNWEAAQHSPSIQQTSEVYLNGRSGDSQHSSDSEFY